MVIHPGDYLLPELGEELGRYAERKMRERKVEVIKGARVASYDGWVVTLNNGLSIPAATLIWTAGVKPSPVVAALPCAERERTDCCRSISPGSWIHRAVDGGRLCGGSGWIRNRNLFPAHGAARNA